MSALSFSSPARSPRKPGTLLMSLLALCVLLLAACGGGSSTSSKKADTLWVAQLGDQYTDNFNPYAGGSGGPPHELIYESLLYTNYATGKMLPWLATSYKFSNDNKTLTFTIRDKVSWNDGQPFSANDVAFTLNLMHKYPAIDVSTIWSYLSSVTAPDAHTVVINFKTVFTPMIWYLGRLEMLPEHIWSSVGDPSKYIDSKAIGTGPFMVESFDPQVVTLNQNPHYWQAKPKFARVKYPVYKSNDTYLLNLINDKVDWGNIFAPNLDKNFVQRDPEHHRYWFAPNDTVMFYVNNLKSPFNQLAVRQAISDALDRAKMSTVAENGYEQVASPTALLLPNAKDYLLPEYANLTFKQDPQKAIQTLESAGYKKGKDGIFADAQGNRLAFKIDVPTNYSDRILLSQIASENLKAVGIDASINTLSPTDWYNNKQLGKYDMTIDSDQGGITPFYYFNRVLNSHRSAAIGQQSQSNFGRWQDPTTDRLLNQYATTSDPEVQKQAIQGLEKIFVEQLPTIPLLDAPTWFEYNTQHFTGWPDKSNPYATTYPPLLVILALEPR
ncbi:ABC transporter substrate-binding protein [Ktedonosporobacter rubrisoli]|uniref:ABC transporter substrate-binding protein n=1 Tax=Ktedonosporobacter rubrisoli TaxID=2509675 RepID=A0A4P6JNS3_KTERU|nr:ABC transporter substrate-binding protein [Ktedonosporobacter rubrisoli]QBD76968.1 ABC transporter substrate-binding protein [Ktedonosporobacter rubrisoli]